MTNEQAKREAKKRWGDKFYIRNGTHFSSQERRDTARAESKEAKAEIDAIEAEIKERLSRLDWYQELRTRQRELHKKRDKAQGESMHYRFNVGRSNGMFTTILGQGDTWEQAFEAANGKHF